MAARYALYYAPGAATALWRFGSAVLGRDAETGEDVPHLVPEGFAVDCWHGLTAAPRHYGFHGTLKPPFALAAGRTEDELKQALAAFAATSRHVARPALAVECLGGFVALTPTHETTALDALAGACVEAFDDFRAAPTEAERARRLATPLTARQKAHLDRWGYPYVFADFRFHMTLTGSLAADDAARAAEGLASLLAQHVPVDEVGPDHLALFIEPRAGEPFRLVARYPLGT